jgi:hypothetical protein
MKKALHIGTMIKNRERWQIAGAVGLLCAFTFFFFGPLEQYLTNQSTFWFSIYDLLPVISVSFILAFIVLFLLIYFISPKGIGWGSTFFFGLGLALYVQGNYLFNSYGLLNGQEIDWGNYTKWGIANTAIWIVFMVAPFLLLRWKPVILSKVCRAISLLIVGIQIATLGTLVIMTDGLSNKEATSSAYLSTDGMFEFSSKDNLVVFVLDSFNTEYFNEILEDEPDLRKQFQDFTFYDNCTSLFSTTALAVPNLLTGQPYKNEQPRRDYMEEAYSQAELYKIIHEKDYGVYAYTYNTVVSNSAPFDNLTRAPLQISSVAEFTERLYQFVSIKYVPHYLKRFAWMDTSVFHGLSKARTGYPDQYIVDDVGFYQNMKKASFQVDNREGTFHFYHLMGAHGPIIYDSNFRPVEDGDLIDQGHGAIKIVLAHVQKLKEIGIYDNTTIMIAADHGKGEHEIILLMKEKNSEKDFSISHAPLSATDLYPTLLESVSQEDQASSIYDWQEGEFRARQSYSYPWESDSWNSEYLPYINKHYLYDYPGRLVGYFTKVAFSENDAQDIRYRLGEDIPFCSESQYIEYGVYADTEEDFTWTWGNWMEMVLRPDAAPESSVLRINLKYIKGESQRLGLYVNDQPLEEITVLNGTPYVEIPLPPDAFSQPELRLRFHFPDASSFASTNPESSDERVVAFGIESISIQPWQTDTDFLTGPSYTIGEEILFNSEENLDKYVLYGTFPPEGDFSWTQDNQMEMTLQPDTTPQSSVLRINLKHIKGESQRLGLYVNDQPLEEVTVMNGTPYVEIPLPSDTFSQPELRLRFHFPDASSFASTDPKSPDERTVAFGIESISIQ